MWRFLAIIHILFATADNPLEPVRFFIYCRVCRVTVWVFDEFQQLPEILGGESIDRPIGELGKHMSDPVDEITFKTCVLLTNRRHCNQGHVAQGLDLPGLGLDCLCGFGGKLDQLLLDFIRCL